ncbi:MAG: hypothetical protein WAN74_06270 [Thermoplasmata archaeon]
MNPSSDPGAPLGGDEELRALRARVLMWKESYREWPPEEAARQFEWEVQEIVYPYLVRLADAGYISTTEYHEVSGFIEQQVRELKMIEEESVCPK